ncbi:MAG: S8 family serine peptidase [Cyclobacteriaceae bacterium]|nr:S8 family serine peptidase [Cyclobacteriaceae bacterium]
MKRVFSFLFSRYYLPVLFALLFACQPDEVGVRDNIMSDTVQDRENAYIVMYKPDALTGMRGVTNYADRIAYVQGESMRLVRSLGTDFGRIEQVYGGVIMGFSIIINDPSRLDVLRNDSRIDYVEKDKIITLGRPSADARPGGGTPPPQEVPWGITRVNGGVNYTGSNVAWVIDTGIDLDHPDLNVDVNASRSFLSGKDATDPNDYHGHGSHVAGTIAALDNSEGVKGVAAGATVIAIRVLDRRGSGFLSGVIGGVDYVGATGSAGDVANMSLGGGVSQALDDAVVAASQGGVKFALAAGNESDDANNHSPARANGANIYTISAMNSQDIFASFSNYGNPPIEYCAPGVSVYSTWKDGGYNTISGTSMATPHAAGVLLLGPARTSGTVIGDPDGNADPIISH